MTVTASPREPIDSALRRLQRAASTEEILETLQKRTKFRKKQQELAQVNKVLSKMKRRRRAAKRASSVKGTPRR
ncbi:30S ribosomal protein S21 [bacterium]|nr:MAG: 30S ribosomal protein S21 [bacterium]